MTEKESKIRLHDSSGRPKHDRDLVDRISAIPDSILGLILSFLPTKNAVATSILSRRWKFAWVTINNLDFQYIRNEHNEGERMKFVGFVNRVLLLHGTGLLNKFSLDWFTCCISSHVTSWINTAITNNVQELSLFLTTDDGHSEMTDDGQSEMTDDGQLEMPIRVFNCNSLRSLDLEGDIYVSAAIPVFLPKLRTLKLEGVDFQSEEAFEKLISGCPILNYLYLQMYRNDGFTFIISSTSLRRIEISFDDRCGLKLNASSLEYLMVSGWISEIFVQNNLSSLDEADFRIIHEERSYNSIVEAIRAFDSAETLTLSGDALAALRNATISLSTKFKRLVELEVDTCSSLLDFIQYTDNLEVLTINQDGVNEWEKWNSPVEWNSPVQVPRCLSSSLTTVMVYGCHVYEHDRETIRYILKHASALEVMQISCGGSVNVNDNPMLKLVKEISEFPRKSPVCEVKFFNET